MTTKTIDDIALAGKKVLVRVDFNVPMTPDLKVSDDKRIVERVAGRDGEHLVEASTEEGGAREEDQGQRDLHDDEPFAQAQLPAAAGAAARLVGEGIGDARGPRSQRGDQAQHAGGDGRGGNGEHDGRPAHRDVVEPLHRRRCEHDEQADGRDRQHDTERGACHGEHECLGKQLPADAPRGRTHRQLHRELCATGGGAGHQQVRDIGACDEQQQDRCGEEKLQRGLRR